MSASDKDTKKAVLAGAVTLLLAAIVLIVPPVRKQSSHWRPRLASLHNSLVVGMSRAEVDEQIKRVDWPPDLIARSGDEIIVSTPMTFGAKNWVLMIALKGEILDAVQMRNADSQQLLPPGAPIDKIAGASPTE